MISRATLPQITQQLQVAYGLVLVQPHSLLIRRTTLLITRIQSEEMAILSKKRSLQA